jgi:hypothetical protein
MQQLFHQDEIRNFAEVPIGEDVALKEAEVSLAIQLIEQIGQRPVRARQVRRRGATGARGDPAKVEGHGGVWPRRRRPQGADHRL